MGETDLISRREAIEAAIEAADKWDGGYNYERELILTEGLQRLPSVQPDRELIEQLRWERDTAIQQLKELGYGLGEKPRTDDTISRQAAIDAVMETEPYLGTENIVYQRTDDVIANINKLPSVQPERWIPCSERLPDMHDEVLVTARGEVSIAWLYVDGKWRSNDMPQPMFRDIIAWMPLPEPYKEEQECTKKI